MEDSFFSLKSLYKVVKVVLVSTAAALTTRLFNEVLAAGVGNEADEQLAAWGESADLDAPLCPDKYQGQEAFLAVSHQIPNMTFTKGVIESFSVPAHWFIDDYDWVAVLDVFYRDEPGMPSWLTVHAPVDWLEQDVVFQALGINDIDIIPPLNTPMQYAKAIGSTLYMLTNDKIITWDESSPSERSLYDFRYQPKGAWDLTENMVGVVVWNNVSAVVSDSKYDYYMTLLDMDNLNDISVLSTLKIEPLNHEKIVVNDMLVDLSRHCAYVFMSNLYNNIQSIDAFSFVDSSNVMRLTTVQFESDLGVNYYLSKRFLKEGGMAFAYDVIQHDSPLGALVYEIKQTQSGNLTDITLLANTTSTLNTTTINNAVAIDLDDYFFTNTSMVAIENVLVNVTGKYEPRATRLAHYYLDGVGLASHLSFSTKRDAGHLMIDDYFYWIQAPAPCCEGGAQLATISFDGAFSATVEHLLSVPVGHGVVLTQGPTGYHFDPGSGNWTAGIQFVNISNPTVATLSEAIAGRVSALVIHKGLLSLFGHTDLDGLSLKLFTRKFGYWSFFQERRLEVMAIESFEFYANHIYIKSSSMLESYYYGSGEWTIISTVYLEDSDEFDLVIRATSSITCKELFYPFNVRLNGIPGLLYEPRVQSLDFGEDWAYIFQPGLIANPPEDVLLIKPIFSSDVAVGWMNAQYYPTAALQGAPLDSNDNTIIEYFDDGVMMTYEDNGEYDVGGPATINFWQWDFGVGATHLSSFAFADIGVSRAVQKKGSLLYAVVVSAPDELQTINYTLSVFNLSSPLTPTVLSSYVGQIEDYEISTEVLLAVEGGVGVASFPVYSDLGPESHSRLFNITNPYEIVYLSEYSDNSQRYIQLIFDHDYFLYGIGVFGAVESISVVDPTNPVWLTTYDLDNYDSVFTVANLVDQRIFLTQIRSDAEPYYLAFNLLDISDPRNLVNVFAHSDHQFSNVLGTYVLDHFVFLIIQDQYLVDYFGVFDITNDNQLNWIYHEPLPKNRCTARHAHLTLYHTGLLGFDTSDRIQSCVFELDYTVLKLSTSLVPVATHSLIETTWSVIDAYNTEFTFPLKLGFNNHPPLVDHPMGNRSVNIGHAVNLEIGGIFVDQDGDKLVLSVEAIPGGLPSWLTYSPQLQKFFGQPQDDHDATTLRIHVQASDGYGGVASDSFYFIVNIPPVVKQAIPSHLFLVDMDANFTFNAAVFESKNDLNYSSTLMNGEDLPIGLTFNAPLRQFSVGQSLLSGVYDIEVDASDQYHGSVSTSFTLTTVIPPSVSTALLETTIYINGAGLNYKIPNNVFVANPGHHLLLNASCVHGLSKPAQSLGYFSTRILHA